MNFSQKSKEGYCKSRAFKKREIPNGFRRHWNYAKERRTGNRFYCITVRQMGHPESTRNNLERLTTLMADGKVKIVIEETYPFEAGLDALKKTETQYAKEAVVKIG